MKACIGGGMADSDGDRFRTRGISRPSVSAIPFREASDGKMSRLLDERERAQLAQIATTVRFARGAPIYREGDPARFVYNISAGVVRTFRTSPDGARSVVAFLFPDDLFGLAENGAYANAAEAVTSVIAYRLPLPALENLLRQDPGLEWHLLIKLCHEVREAQRHLIILGQRGALARLALFLEALDHAREAGDGGDGEIYLPMRRSDIADYVGLSPAVVSRSFRTLAARQLVRFRDRRHLLIVDRAGLSKVARRDEGAADARV